MTLKEIERRLRVLKAMGYVPTIRKGSTGVGHTLLCEDCGMALHNDFIADTLQAKYFSKTKKTKRGNKRKL